MAQVKVKGSGILFQNSFLERFTRTNPLVILSMYIPFCAFLLWYFYTYVQPSPVIVASTFFIGLFSWTFFEYILHRYIFHFISDNAGAQKLLYVMHGVHHEYPRDKKRLVMPPVPSMLAAGIFYVLFRLLLGTYVFAFLSGFIIGYLIYAMTHYSIHAFRAPKGRAKYLWEYHNIHHFRQTDKAFGVSSPFWDLVFGTYPEKVTAKKPVTVEAGG